uniref:RING-type domain-containing protein n=1 Tax=Gadus morhua TaxID=8049 RepID=A0A8C5BH36_GADMO
MAHTSSQVNDLSCSTVRIHSVTTMADASSQIDDLSCSVCCDIFKDPVLLSCSHSFCKGCLQSWWTQNEEQKLRSCRDPQGRNS